MKPRDKRISTARITSDRHGKGACRDRFPTWLQCDFRRVQHGEVVHPSVHRFYVRRIEAPETNPGERWLRIAILGVRGSQSSDSSTGTKSERPRLRAPSHL